MSLEDMIAKKAKEAVEAKFGVDPDDYLGKVGMSTDTVIERAGGMLGLGSLLGEHTPAPEHAAEHQAEKPCEDTEDTRNTDQTDDSEENSGQEEERQNDSNDSEEETDSENEENKDDE